VQKQVPYLLSAFGIDEPTENVRANIKKVLPPARNPRSPPSPQGICWAASCLPAPPPKPALLYLRWASHVTAF
jgi:hypothetical protein